DEPRERAAAGCGPRNRSTSLEFGSVDMTMVNMTSRLSPPLWALLTGWIAAMALLAHVPAAGAQTVIVMVNGHPITHFDIEQRTKLDFLSTHKASSRQEVLSELIEQKLKIKEAKKFGVDPSGSDIDQAYSEMSSRMRITPDQLSKSLEAQGIRPETLKAR